MKIFERTFDPELNFSLSALGIKAENALFFDIETTGLSAYRANLYLIGVVFYEPEQEDWHLLQYFAESAADELPMLHAFFELLRTRKQLVSFNGEGFDIPFLKAMCTQYGLPQPFDSVESFDIFRLLRPGKSLLRLPSYRLKSCERFLGIEREDRFDGGELILLYQAYLRDRDPKKLRTLLLHNAEDLENLPRILPILSYSFIRSAPALLRHKDLIPLPTGDGVCLDLLYESEISLPRPVDLDTAELKKSGFLPNTVLLNITGGEINLSVRLYEGELKYFHADYKNYYYLPAEDTAVHCSLAEFVDSRSRERASAKTAYQRRCGLFLPELSPVFTPVFLREYKDKALFAEWRDSLFTEETQALRYLRDFFSLL